MCAGWGGDLKSHIIKRELIWIICGLKSYGMHTWMYFGGFDHSGLDLTLCPAVGVGQLVLEEPDSSFEVLSPEYPRLLSVEI